MAEIRLLVDQLKFSYDGIFDLPGLYQLISNFFYERGWDYGEPMNTEQIFPSGRSVRIVMKPSKNITDYYQNIVRIRIHGQNIKPIEIDQGASKVPLNDGKIMIIFDGYVKTDRYNKWERRPLTWFLRTLMDKYVFKDHMSKADQWLYSDIEDLYLRIKTFMNVYRSARDRQVVTYQILG